MATTEGWHTTDDGHKLYTKTWTTQGPARACLVFIHGFSDHINTYGTFFPLLASHGIEVHGFDQRGWGRSVHKKAERGDTGPTSRVLLDMSSFLSSLIPSRVPLFLMGHSMGGGQVLYYAAHGPHKIQQHIRGYVLESPFVDFDPKSKPSPVTVFLGRLAGKLLPHRQLVNKLDAKLISRDPEACRRFEQDELCHDTGTLEGLAGMLDRTAELAAGKVVVRDDAGEAGVARVWIGHGDDDGITSFKASQHFADNLKVKDKEFKAYKGYFHRLHDEPSPDKEVFMDDVATWILARSAEPVHADSAKPKL